jgi:hypothetical protein
MSQTIANCFRMILQTIGQRIKHVTKPANSSLVSDMVISLTRSKHDLLIENALLRQ